MRAAKLEQVRDWVHGHRHDLLAGLLTSVIGGALLTIAIWAFEGDDRKASPEEAEVEAAAAALGCRRAVGDHRAALIQGRLDVRKAIPGAEYSDSVSVEPGEKVTFQLWLFNRELDEDVLNVRVRILTDEHPAITVPIEGQGCGSNTYLVREGATVVSLGRPIRLRFEPGSVYIRSFVEGKYATRGGSDLLFRSSRGESLGRLEAQRDADHAHMTVIVSAEVEAGPE